MKKLLILSSVVLFSLTLFAQQETIYNTKKTEVNIAVSNIFAKDNYSSLVYYYINSYEYLLSDYDYLTVYRNPEASVGVKIHNNKGAFRLSASFNYRNYKYEDNGESNDYNYKINHAGTRINFGYECDKTIGRLVIYYGCDLSYSFMKLYVKSESEENDYLSESTIKQNTVGINPFLGTNVFIFPNLSIGTEFKFFNEYVFGNEKYERESSYYYSSSSEEEKFTGFKSYFGPLGFISVNLYF